MTSSDKSQRFLDEHEELKPGQPFRFACHPGVSCFGACCSALDLMLTPYDVLRLRRALNTGSRQFLREYTDAGLMPGLGLPLPTLHMQDTEAKRCPFSQSDHRCAVYENRPSACRTYPLGRATRRAQDGAEDHGAGVVEQIFVIREPHCHGFEEAREWSPASWMDDQGLAAYNAMSDRFMALADGLRHMLAITGQHLGQQQTGMAGLALYQPDEFQHFLTASGLLDKLDMDAARREAVLTDEEACLEFGFDWLELSLLGKAERLRPKGYTA
jgi:Fe-S-cluster containining protein